MRQYLENFALLFKTHRFNPSSEQRCYNYYTGQCILNYLNLNSINTLTFTA
jgi:hypothetical protein